MPEPAYAVVDILCHARRLAELEAIANLVIEVRPMRTKDPALVRIAALADAAAQDAVRALGCTVTVVKSAEDYRAQVVDAYRNLDQHAGDDRPS